MQNILIWAHRKHIPGAVPTVQGGFQGYRVRAGLYDENPLFSDAVRQIAFSFVIRSNGAYCMDSVPNGLVIYPTATHEAMRVYNARIRAAADMFFASLYPEHHAQELPRMAAAWRAGCGLRVRRQLRAHGKRYPVLCASVGVDAVPVQ